MTTQITPQQAALALPASVEKWVLAQEIPFLVDEVRAIAGDGGLGREELARRLAAHPSVARVGEKHYTPRILAHRASFVVRLLPEERAIGVLVPGHRFLPFYSLDEMPQPLTLVGQGGAEASLEDVYVSRETLFESCRLLADIDLDDEDVDEGDWEASAVSLEEVLSTTRTPAEIELHCLDFPGARCSVRPHTPAPTADWRKAKEAFLPELMAILQSPPPGPVFAGRQLLHVVASALEKGWTRPVGPLGPLLTADDRVSIEVVKDRTAFALARPATMPPGGSGTLLPALQSLLQQTERSIKHGHEVRGTAARLTWDSERLHASADVSHLGDYWGCRTSMDLSKAPAGVRSICQCQQHRDKGVCKHAIVLLREVIAQLRMPDSETGKRILADLYRPAWSRALEKLGKIAAAGAPPPAPAEVSRVTWRIQEHGESLQVIPYVQKLQASGGWTRGRAMRSDALAVGQEPSATEADRSAAAATGGRSRWGRYEHGDAFDVLACLSGHPHVHWEADLDRTVRIEKAGMRLRFDARETGDVVPALSAGGIDFDNGGSWFAASNGFILVDREAARVVLVPAGKPLQDLVALVAGTRPVFPPETRAELTEKLPGLEMMLPVDLPAELAGEEVPADTRLRLRLAPDASSGLVASLRVRPLDGGPLLAPGDPPERVSDMAQGRRVCVRRRLADEHARAREVAAGLGIAGQPAIQPWTWRVESDDDALDLIASLQDDRWKELIVEWDEAARKMLLSREATPKDLRVSVQEAQDWFGIEGELDIDGTIVPLAEIFQALREGRRYVPVKGGMWVRISKLFQDRLREMGDLLQLDHGKLRIGPEAAPLLRDVVRETGLTKACRAWDTFLERFDRAMKIEPKPPKGFTAEFRPYQLEGYRWLARLAAWGVGGILADDMGLGKTVQALALLLDRAKEGPALVIAPTSVSSNWVAETQRFAPKLRPLLYRETDRASAPDNFGKGDLVVVSYAMAMRDVERLEKVKWGTLLLDEAQFVKNSQTKTAQAVRRIAAGWRGALTGTPIENHLGDLWSLFRAVSPGLFGSWERFRERFAAPIERDHDPARRGALARLVRPFVLRRTKDQVLQELPERTEIRLDAELSTEERKLYDQARIAALAKLATKGEGEDQRFQVLAALTRLRQLACHPRLVLAETKATSAKLELFLETVDELREGGHRALVFSQFTSLLALVREALDARGVKYQYLDGSTPAPKRDVAIKAFQGGEGDLFLISLKAGGTGLNLTAADYVIHLDPWWNPAVEDQATNRAHRIGQTRPVTVYRIVATKTIEEKILSLHASKRDLVEGVLDGADQAGKLSTEELISLIREG